MNFTRPMLPLLSPDIPAALACLQEKYVIHLITASNSRWSTDRIRNLIQLGLPFDTIQFGQSDKLPAIKELQPFAVIEDRPATIQALLENGFRVLAPGQWNYVITSSQVSGATIYESWTEVLKLLRLPASAAKQILLTRKTPLMKI